MMGAVDLFTLEGKVAIVTGASVGLGACFAEAMAEAGADVVGADCQEKLLDETMERIGKLGRRVLAIPTDVTKEQDVRRMVETTVKEFGSLDIIINNAGIAGKSHPIHELSFEDWDKVVQVNLNGVFFCIREAAKVMIKQKSGKIINIASVWGLVGTSSVAPLPHYAATKGAVVNLTREAA
ncbi:MAG: SDR family NAD(P)-dependent oxidoreductase, partial [Dehalococcoidia bacterium]|nr:SDR family NAD(P)-dependent oxidoreductase [Dehalococcoidia bacterium]